jgi:hypothetical protein
MLLLRMLCFTFLAMSGCLAIYNSGGDLRTTTIVIIRSLSLVLLHFCLRLMVNTPQTSSRHRWLIVAMWVLFTLHTVCFTLQITNVLPQKFGVVFCSIAYTNITRAFYVCFIRKNTVAHRLMDMFDSHFCSRFYDIPSFPVVG